MRLGITLFQGVKYGAINICMVSLKNSPLVFQDQRQNENNSWALKGNDSQVSKGNLNIILSMGREREGPLLIPRQA